jgi:uncharacterized membrane protein
MLPSLFLTLAVICIAAQNVTRKAYNKRISFGNFTFPTVASFAALVFYLFYSRFSFSLLDTDILPYSVVFAVSYGVTLIFGFLAITSGPLSLTALMNSYSLICPTLFGMIYFKEQGSVTLYIGLALLAISILLVNLKSGGKSAKITPRWLLYVALSFIGNGICSIAQVLQQRVFGGAGKNEFMIYSLTIVTLGLLIITLLTERRTAVRAVRGGWVYMSLCGLSNGAANLFVMICATAMPASVMYPVISAGGIILSSLISITVYKEKLSSAQYLGLASGIAAVVLCSI